MQIDYDKVKYATNRKLENDKDEKKGSITMFSYDELNFHYKLICPFCEKQEESDIQLERKPYRIPCENCGKKILIKKLNKKEKN